MTRRIFSLWHPFNVMVRPDRAITLNIVLMQMARSSRAMTLKGRHDVEGASHDVEPASHDLKGLRLPPLRRRLGGQQPPFDRLRLIFRLGVNGGRTAPTRRNTFGLGMGHLGMGMGHLRMGDLIARLMVHRSQSGVLGRFPQQALSQLTAAAIFGQLGADRAQFFLGVMRARLNLMQAFGGRGKFFL
jgi:hypothetical protein